MAERGRVWFSWRSKLMVAMTVAAIAPAAGVAWWTTQQFLTEFQESNLDSLSALANAKGEAIDTLVLDRLNQTERISSLVVFELDDLLQLRSEQEVPDDEPAPLEPLEDVEKISESGQETPPEPAPPPKPPPPPSKLRPSPPPWRAG